MASPVAPRPHLVAGEPHWSLWGKQPKKEERKKEKKKEKEKKRKKLLKIVHVSAGLSKLAKWTKLIQSQ